MLNDQSLTESFLERGSEQLGKDRVCRGKWTSTSWEIWRTVHSSQHLEVGPLYPVCVCAGWGGGAGCCKRGRALTQINANSQMGFIWTNLLFQLFVLFCFPDSTEDLLTLISISLFSLYNAQSLLHKLVSSDFSPLLWWSGMKSCLFNFGISFALTWSIILKFLLERLQWFQMKQPLSINVT